MFRFTIRDVLWLTVVVALAVGWWLDRARTHATLTTYQAEIQEWEAAANRLSNERQLLKKQLWQASSQTSPIISQQH
jgi:hypothetical protein